MVPDVARGLSAETAAFPLKVRMAFSDPIGIGHWVIFNPVGRGIHFAGYVLTRSTIVVDIFRGSGDVNMFMMVFAAGAGVAAGLLTRVSMATTTGFGTIITLANAQNPTF